jgi:hypothetical protein
MTEFTSLLFDRPVALPQGTPIYGGECPSWAERTARIAWNRTVSLCSDWRDNVGNGFLLTCEVGDLASGATAVAALVREPEEAARGL